jgi:ADP-ribosyl-[dinitrogen reductase] hydrolase
VTTLDRYRGALLGLAAGDALGTTLEFRSPGTFEPIDEIVGGGPFGLKPGQWTDDTSMALCLAASVVETGGFNSVDQLTRYVRWWKSGYMSSTGRCFDIGNTTREALARFERAGEPYCGSTDPHSAGNGSLMRLAPVPLAFAANPRRAVALAGDSSRTTHAAVEAVDACRYYAALIIGALNGASKQELIAPNFDFELGLWTDAPLAPGIASVAGGSFLRKEPPKIRGTGYVVDALEAALWAFSRSDSFAAGALLAVKLGDDADTTGAIYGQLAGAFYSAEGIPDRWLSKLAERDLIESLAARLHDFAANDSVSATEGAVTKEIWRAPEEQSSRPIPNSYWVRAGSLAAGEYPGNLDRDTARRRVLLLLDAGVTFFLDLTTEDDKLASYADILDEEAARLGLLVVHRRLPIRDLGVPRTEGEMLDILDAIDGALDAGHTVYAHCWGGIGRTGTVVGCHLVRHGLSGDEALRELAALWQHVEKVQRCPRSPETDEQREYVRTWTGPER